jgi:hypothetical protein
MDEQQLEDLAQVLRESNAPVDVRVRVIRRIAEDLRTFYGIPRMAFFPMCGLTEEGNAKP